ncbi:MAG: hypothetical protein ACLUVV_06430 [Christensenellales bacterium]
MVRTPSTYTFTAKMRYHGVAVESEKPVQLTLAAEGEAPTDAQATPAQTTPPAATQTPGGVGTGDEPADVGAVGRAGCGGRGRRRGAVPKIKRN